MQVKLFTIPLADNGKTLDDLNAFLRGNKVLEMENHLINNERGAVWCFCVKYIESSNGDSKSGKKIDYKEELKEAQFNTFTRLREIRKQIAEDDAVPAYAVFTDEELANIAKLEELTAKNIQTIKGIGAKKVEKYAEKSLKHFEKIDVDLDFLNRNNV